MADKLIDYLKLMILYRNESADIWSKYRLLDLNDWEYPYSIDAKKKCKEELLLRFGGGLTKSELESLKNSIEFLEKYKLDFKNYSIEHFTQEIIKSESFLIILENEIQNYQPVTFESTIPKNDLELLKLGKKYDSDELDSIYLKPILWVLIPICIYSTIKLSVENSHNIIQFIISLFPIGLCTVFIGMFFGVILSFIAGMIYKSINKKKIERYKNLINQQRSFKYNDHTAKLIINESILNIEEYKNRIISFKASIIDYEIKQRNLERWRKENQEKELQRQLFLEEQERQIEIFRKKADYWLNLSGYSFEDEVSVLFSKKGFKIQRTPYSGDGGIDLIVYDENGKMGIVQCKNFNKQASPSIARDLYGTKHAIMADFCILVCSGGFTSGTIKFAKENDIQLIDIQDLINMSS